MLSVKKLGSSAAAVSYYERDDYYLGHDRAPEAAGEWVGAGAEALGVNGPVEKSQFKALLEGRLPDGSVLGRWSNGERQHVPGWDFTFSAPKSVSLLAQIGGDRRLLEAHGRAVREAVAWLEREGAAYRQMQKGEIRLVSSANLAVALFQHDTSREQDPQLHTHAVVVNTTRRDDGSWASLESKPLFEAKMAGGAVYRAALARSVRELGYEIQMGPHPSMFEIAGVPEKVREAFSGRREQIKEALASRGLEGVENAARAALMTRRAKEHLDRESLSRTWGERLAQTGFDPGPLIEQAQMRAGRRDLEPGDAYRAVEPAIAGLSEREAVFTHLDLIRGALIAGMGRVGVADIEAAVTDLTRGRSLIEASLGGRAAWTTPRAKEQEQRTLDALRQGADKFEPVLERGRVDQRLDQPGDGVKLNESQRQAAKTLLSSRDQFVGIVGLPGTGKTTLLRQVAALMSEQGHTAVGMARTADAAQKLQSESGIGAGTLAGHLQRVKSDLAALKNVADREGILGRYRQQVWIVDEASQVGSGEMRQLTHAAQALNVRVALIGDPKQLGAIDAGRPFALMLDAGMRHSQLDQIVRQRDGQFREAILAARSGEIGAALDRLDGHVVELPDAGERVDAIVARWKALGQAREQAVVLTPTRAGKAVLDGRLREVLKAEGQISKEQAIPNLSRKSLAPAARGEAVSYAPGDVLYFGRNLKRLGIRSGEPWRVEAIDPDTNLVSLATSRPDGPHRLEWNPAPRGSGAQRLSVFAAGSQPVGVGDSLQWKHNERSAGLVNGDRVRVVGVSPTQLEVEKADGRRVQVDPRDPSGQHWSYGYATTIYSSQGASVPHVLVNADSSAGALLDQKAFQVAISRQREDLTLFTDDREELARVVAGRLGDKTSALEAIEQRRVRLDESRDRSWMTIPALEPAPSRAEPEISHSPGMSL